MGPGTSDMLFLLAPAQNANRRKYKHDLNERSLDDECPITNGGLRCEMTNAPGHTFRGGIVNRPSASREDGKGAGLVATMHIFAGSAEVEHGSPLRCRWCKMSRDG